MLEHLLTLSLIENLQKISIKLIVDVQVINDLRMNRIETLFLKFGVENNEVSM